MTELREGDVGEVSDTGSRLLFAAGTPEAEAWWAENSEPHDLAEVTPTNDPVPPDDLTLTPPVEPDVPDLPEPDPTDPETHEVGDPE